MTSSDRDDFTSWLNGREEQAGSSGKQEVLHPVLIEFRELIETDPVVRVYIHQMIDQVPCMKPHCQPRLRSVEQMMRLLNAVLTRAPEFGEPTVMLPLGTVFGAARSTPAGVAVFRDPRINAILKKILTAWCAFLGSADSLYVINDSPAGWKCPAARKELGIEQFEHIPEDEHWGFTSWNDFFIRRFREGERPVAAPDDDTVIICACEAQPYRIATGVQRQDRFWIKSQPYSLREMLADDDSVAQFVGGTVYQACLDVTYYHRWHSPVSGTVVKAFLRQGTYYSEAVSADWEAVIRPISLSYLAHLAVRTVVLIEADNPAIGLVAFVAIGIGEVSSCVIDDKVTPGHRVAKGAELGCFQFGGSTYCLVFRPGVIASFAAAAIPRRQNFDGPKALVCSELAIANEKG